MIVVSGINMMYFILEVVLEIIVEKMMIVVRKVLGELKVKKCSI